MTVSKSSLSQLEEALPVSGVSRAIERLEVTFDDESLVANAGLVVPATLMVRLGLEALVNATVRLRAGSVGRGRVARCVRWSRRSWRAARTSIMPTCCVRVRHNGCCRSG